MKRAVAVIAAALFVGCTDSQPPEWKKVVADPAAICSAVENHQELFTIRLTSPYGVDTALRKWMNENPNYRVVSCVVIRRGDFDTLMMLIVE